MKSYVRLQTQVLQHNPLCCVKPSRLLLHKFACVTLDFTNRQRPFMSLSIIRRTARFFALALFPRDPLLLFLQRLYVGWKAPRLPAEPSKLFLATAGYVDAEDVRHWYYCRSAIQGDKTRHSDHCSTALHCFDFLLTCKQCMGRPLALLRRPGRV